MYQNEENIIAQAQQLLEEKTLTTNALWEEYEKLLKNYESMLKEVKVLNRISDRQINKQKESDAS